MRIKRFFRFTSKDASDGFSEWHADAPERLIIRHPSKTKLFKYLFNMYLLRGGTNFLLTFTLHQLCNESRVETWVNWQIFDLFQWYFSAPYRLAPRAPARLPHPLIRTWPKYIGCCIYIFWTHSRLVWYMQTDEEGELNFICSLLNDVFL
jgi:hypothetical protein